MSILTLIRRRIRLARMRDTAYQLEWVRASYRERALGLSRELRRLEHAHQRDTHTPGPTARDIARSVERRIKQPIYQ